jgi:4-amino-4-deoxy-L-arabinose transferase-like glycosyltransferase
VFSQSFGHSLFALRAIPAVFSGVATYVACLFAYDLGGEIFAIALAALVTIASPVLMAFGARFSPDTIEAATWSLIALWVWRITKGANPRWWLAVGAGIGVGAMTKYTMAFFVAGIVGGVLLTPARRYLKSPWLWAGAGLSVLIFLPNLVWQIRHDFVSLHFLEHIHKRDVGEGRANGFVRDQFLISTNLFAVQLWLAGLYYFSRPRTESDTGFSAGST